MVSKNYSALPGVMVPVELKSMGQVPMGWESCSTVLTLTAQM